MAGLFGGSDRTAMLAALANSSEPLTGYRVARISGVQPIKVYNELRQLARIGVVTECSLELGKKGWQMTDPDLRNFLRRRVRLFWSQSFLRDRRKDASRAEAINKQWAEQPPIDLEKYIRPEWIPQFPEDYERPPEKDQVLARLGLRTSNRKRPKR